jgi:extracellular matrix protein 14
MNLRRSFADPQQLLDIDVWRLTRNYVDIRADHSSISNLRAFLPSGANLTTWIPELQSLVDSTTSSLTSSLGDDGVSAWDGFPLDSLDTPFHDAYHSLEELYAFGDQLAERFSKGRTTVRALIMGRTFEGREIRGWSAGIADEEKEGLKKGKRKGGRRAGQDEMEDVRLKREFVVQSGQHAREVRHFRMAV